MPKNAEYWDGSEWEDHVFQLLQDRHGAENLQKVPAKHGGDCGIDYYCLQERTVYQCYAVEGEVSVAVRAEKQKVKMTTDLGKLCDPDKGATKLFANHPIRRWILMVPLHDSVDVLQHAAKKTSDVKAKQLNHIDPDFQVGVHDRESFDPSSWSRRMALRNRIKPSVDEVTPEAIAAVSGSDQSLADNLRSKLGPRFSDPSELEVAIDDSFRVFIEARNTVEALRDLVPEAHEEIITLVAQRHRRLRLGSRNVNADPLDTEISSLKASILASVPNLDPMTAENIAFGSVADWLMRCPLKLD